MGNTVQSTYNDRMDAGRAGQMANSVPATLLSRTVEDEDGIGFGVAVAQGDNDKGCKAFGAGDTEVLGITVRQRSMDANEGDTFAQYEAARIMTKGVIFVTASVAVEAGDPVYVVPATGAFQKTNASSAVQIANARWDTSADADALAQVRMG